MGIDSFIGWYGFGAGIFAIFGFTYLVIHQLHAVGSPKDKYTILRWLTLTLLVILVLTFAPRVVYQHYRIRGVELPDLRRASSVAASTGTIATVTLFILIARINLNDDE